VDPAAILDSIDQLARSELERWTVPGMVVGLASEGEVAVRAWGLADLAAGEPMQPETPFRIASITKPFLASLAMSLVQDGALALDEPLSGFRLPHAGTTLRHLLSHRGGLVTEWPVPISRYGDGEDCLELLARDEPLALPVAPGEVFSYANAGFSLAGAVIARAGGTTVEAAMQERILDPLGLEQTGFEPYAAPALGHVQTAPGADEQVAAFAPYPRGRRPSGGLYSTATDLIAFARHHLGGDDDPLTAASRATMQQPLATTSDGHYGLGFALRGKIVEHGGNIAGYRSLLLLRPEDGLVFVALTNSGRGHTVINSLLAELGLGRARPPRVGADLGGLSGRWRQGLTEAEVVPVDEGVRVQVVETDPISCDRRPLVPLQAVPVGETEALVVGGEEDGTRIALLRPGLLRIGLRVYVREG
jgi:CubicO group peptidase (beta-lactamase class C family)